MTNVDAKIKMLTSPFGDASIFIYGDKGIRTPDLLNAIQTRSQLRHTPRYDYYDTRIDSDLQGFCQ